MGFLKKFQDTEKEATVKAFKADCLRMLPLEHKSEMQLLREENEWLKMVLKDCEKKHVDEKSRRVVDMTRPQPCNMFDVAAGEAWAKELGKHMYEVIKDVIYMEQFFDCIERADEETLAEKLTDIITVCTSWIDALGYDEVKRGKLQERVNEKNLRRGNRSIGDDEALTMRQEEADIMITGKLGYNPKTKRYGLLVADLWEHTGLHCGERLEIEVDGVWVKTRMEMNPKQQWYLVGTPYCDGDLENMRARVSRTLQEAW